MVEGDREGIRTAEEIAAPLRERVRTVGPGALAGVQTDGKPAVLLDIREPGELIVGTIPGALTIPRGLLELQIPRAIPDPDRPVILFCSGGVRSFLAAETLSSMGYHDVRVLEGGFPSWALSERGTAS